MERKNGEGSEQEVVGVAYTRVKNIHATKPIKDIPMFASLNRNELCMIFDHITLFYLMRLILPFLVAISPVRNVTSRQ